MTDLLTAQSATFGEASEMPAGDPWAKQVGAAVRSGHLAVDVEFRAGKSPMMASWSLETAGAQEKYLQALGNLNRYDKQPSIDRAISGEAPLDDRGIHSVTPIAGNELDLESA